MRILVIEDDVSTGDYLKKGLGEAGYRVDLARNGADGLFIALEESFDAIILDVMLPGLNGWQVMEVLRKKSDVPVLFLTARDEVQDRIHGLELGADDYLIKTFFIYRADAARAYLAAARDGARVRYLLAGRPASRRSQTQGYSSGNRHPADK